MIGQEITDEVTDKVSAIESKRVLLGFLGPDEAHNILQSSHQLEQPESIPVQGDEDAENGQQQITVEEVQEEWQAAKRAIKDFNGFAVDYPPVEELPEDDAITAHIDEFLDTAAFKDTFADVPDGSWRIRRVPIDHLVAFQTNVATDAYRDEIPSWDNDPAGVLEYTLPTDGHQLQLEQDIGSPDSSYFGKQIVTRGPNLQAAGVMVQDLENFDVNQEALNGNGEAEAVNGEGPQPELPNIPDRGRLVGFFVIPKANFVQVAQYRGRYILKNGYHRTYQLMQAGETHVPAVIRDVNIWEATGATKPGHLSEDIVMSDRPPMLTDFDSDVAVDTKEPATNRVVRLTAETTDIVR